jgi:hypothetical protein
LKWIDTNLKGRYWFGNTTKLQDNRIVAYEAVAFEDSHEATLFLLGCSALAKTKETY